MPILVNVDPSNITIAWPVLTDFASNGRDPNVPVYYFLEAS